MINKLLSWSIGFILILFIVLMINWLQVSDAQPNVETVESIFENNNNAIATTLSELIKYKTISHIDSSKNNPSISVRLGEYLGKRFPKVHSTLNLEHVGEHSLLYTWTGSDKTLDPMLLSAHFDVVPVEDQNWQHPPFSGHVDENYIWGRGALDDKSAIAAIMHALTALIQNNYQPRRTLLLAFGSDEEVGGTNGAAKIAEYLLQKNIKLEYLLDEGMPITDGIMKGVDKPVAMIGVAEKGFMNVVLTAAATEGHASSPPKQTAVGILADAIVKLESQPMGARISLPISQLFDSLAGHMQFPQSLVVSNRWLFESLLLSQLTKQNSTNALIRTTMAVTVIEGSERPNVLPKTASATINVRLLPGDSIKTTLAYIENIIDNPNISITLIDNPIEASTISNTDSHGYNSISQSIAEAFPEILIAPSLLIASTDTKHYKNLTKNIYRFRPLWITSDDISRFHGSNERISIKNLEQMTMFYYQLIQNSNT